MGRELSVSDAERDFDRVLESLLFGEYGYHAIELRKRRIAIGQIGLLTSHDKSSAAFANLIDQPHWRRG